MYVKLKNNLHIRILPAWYPIQLNGLLVKSLSEWQERIEHGMSESIKITSNAYHYFRSETFRSTTWT